MPHIPHAPVWKQGLLVREGRPLCYESGMCESKWQQGKILTTRDRASIDLFSNEGPLPVNDNTEI
jgi:hypothetical protein